MAYLADGNRLAGLLFLILMGLCDILDGWVARRTARASSFGAFLDSTIDRLTEGFVFLGFLVWFYRERDGKGLVLTSAALLFSYLVSYTRARGENFIDHCKVGFWERPERLLCLMLALLLNRLKPALWMVAAGSFLTAFHRLCHLKASLTQKALPQKGVPSLLFWSYPRFSIPYFLYCLIVILLVLAIK